MSTMERTVDWELELNRAMGVSRFESFTIC
jgi:hypothetical protein